MNRLFRVDNGNIRRVNITPVEDGFSPKQLAFAHDSTRIPIEYLVLAGWPDYIRTNWEGDSLKHDRLDRKIFREWYETIASEYGDNVIFVIGEQTIDGQARPTLMYPVVPFRVVEGR